MPVKKKAAKKVTRRKKECKHKVKFFDYIHTKKMICMECRKQFDL